jgi:hypothetical protein
MREFEERGMRVMITEGSSERLEIRRDLKLMRISRRQQFQDHEDDNTCGDQRQKKGESLRKVAHLVPDGYNIETDLLQKHQCENV